MSDLSNRRYALFSSDGHAGADLHDYRAYLPRAFHDEFDRWVADFHEPWAEYDTELVDIDDEYIRIGQASFLSPYNWDSEKRLAHLDGQGIAVEVLFPTPCPRSTPPR